ncbi:glycosyltransferase [Okibacterium fritillariae]|uniref:D-inositol 3-phosphate glycosyltransferase n=1 Tax=Okibacterium fritillariae TaxID=123320 RepID=A0A1T5IIH4_9MICO|nr:glycosyltransferase [Okibacterium fritillariae]SKC38838.1 D-inositol-3-phosphate glycosyltransferase [Okibacterium fritillariae]
MGSASRPRVALVSLHTSPLATAGSGDAGGMNVYLRALSDGLVADGFEVDVLTRRTAADQRSVTTRGGARVLFLDAGPAEPVAKEDLHGLVDGFATSAIAAGPYDLVHSHYWLSGLAGERLAAASGAPHLVTLHTLAALKNELLAEGDTPEPEARVAAERALLESARAVIAVSQAEADAAVSLAGAEHERVRVVLPGVDTQLFRPPAVGEDEARCDTNIRRPTVVVAARVQPLKGQDLAIRAIAALPRDRRPQLILAGDATASHAAYVAALHELIEESGLHSTTGGADADVLFAGPLDREQLAETLRRASALLIPSHSETFGLVALEAAASGIPVIASRVGGLPEAVGDNGILLDDRRAESWAAAMDAILAEAHDAAGRTRLRARALAHAAPFGWDAVTHRIGDIYRSHL